MFSPILVILFILSSLCDTYIAQICIGNRNIQCNPELESSTRLRGTIAPVFTPFNKDGSLNLVVIPAYAKFLAAMKVKVIFVNGPDEGGATVSLSDRKRLLTSWVMVCKPLGISIIMDLSGLPYSEVLSLSTYAKIAGADAVLTLPELYYKPNIIDDAITYLSGIAENAKPLPVYYNHRPVQTGVSLNTGKLITKATKAIENFGGLVTSLQNAQLAVNALSSNQSIFVYGSYIIPSVYQYCLNGTINPLNAVFPNITLEIEKSIRDGNYSRAYNCQLQLNNLLYSIIDILNLDVLSGLQIPQIVSLLRAAFIMINDIDVGYAPTPLKPVTETQKKKLRRVLIEAGIISK